jgi:hypothetical protein
VWLPMGEELAVMTSTAPATHWLPGHGLLLWPYACVRHAKRISYRCRRQVNKPRQFDRSDQPSPPAGVRFRGANHIPSRRKRPRISPANRISISRFWYFDFVATRFVDGAQLASLPLVCWVNGLGWSIGGIHYVVALLTPRSCSAATGRSPSTPVNPTRCSNTGGQRYGPAV